MDGNGRWAKKNNLPKKNGHKYGIQNCISLCQGLRDLDYKLKEISFYVFSSENWKRPKTEINFLFKLIKNYFYKEIQNVTKQGIKINILGDMRKLPLDLRNTLIKCENLTKKNNNINVNLAINYGAKDEILMAIKKNKKISLKNLERNLYTKNMPDPDILIRTGGNQRLSNFMLWQLAYTELFFLKKLWPDFKSIDLKNIINKFKKIKRNYGAI